MDGLAIGGGKFAKELSGAQDPAAEEQLNAAMAESFDELERFYKTIGGKQLWSGFRRLDFKHETAATPPTCRYTCITCQDQYTPAMSQVLPECFKTPMDDDETAANKIEDLINTTQDNNVFLRQAIENHGSAIVRRWTKKPAAKRSKILKAALPTIYRRKAADIELHFELTKQASIGTAFKANVTSVKRLREIMSFGHRFQETHLLPYLDEETLSGGMSKTPICSCISPFLTRHQTRYGYLP
jgi:hypothetical protein